MTSFPLVPPLLGALLKSKHLLIRDYKARLPLLGSVTLDLITDKHTSMLSLCFKSMLLYVMYIYVGDEINIYYMYFVKIKLHLLLFLIITIFVPTYLILNANGINISVKVS